MKFSFLSFLLLLLSLLFSITACYESDEIVLGGDPIIFKLQDNNTFYSDTLTLYGEHLSSDADSNYLVINDTLMIDISDCLSWTASKISFVVPLVPRNSTIYVVVASQKIFVANSEDNTYYQDIVVAPYPHFDFVLIPPGVFEIGCDDFGFNDELPKTQLSLTREIIVSSKEINQRLFSLIMNSNPSHEKHPTYPVYNISWLDAIHFCNELSMLDSLTPVYTIVGNNDHISFDISANGWRLPTEAEWEYFADINIDNESDLNQYSWFANNSGLSPKSCGLLDKNRYGLFDVLGNVWEWCWDYYQSDYYSVGSLVNPIGPVQGTYRVFRGGSFSDGKLFVRKSYRGGCLNISNYSNVGFRIVRNNF